MRRMRRAIVEDRFEAFRRSFYAEQEGENP
jgi:queuine/archaeosine tRNA-ribosyltransferase